MESVGLSEAPARPAGRVKWILLSMAVLLSVLTFLTMRYVDRFGIDEEQLLEDAQFLEGNARWQEKGNGVTEFQGNQLKITNRPGVSHSVSQNVQVDTPAFYRFSYNAGVTDVVPTSPEFWALASVAIIFRDESGERTGSRMITTLSGTESSASFTEQLLLTESISSVDFAVRLYRAGGEFFITNPVMSKLKELPIFKGVRAGVVAAWLALFAVLVFFSFRVLKVWQLMILIALTGAAMVGTMMPEALMTAVSQKVAGFVPESLLSNLRSTFSKVYSADKFTHAGTEVSKLGHFLVFSCFGLFAGLLWRKCGFIFAVACIAVLALSTEALQTLVYGRTTNIGDLVIDALGGLTGLLVGVVLAGLFGLIRRKPPLTLQPNSNDEDGIHESS